MKGPLLICLLAFIANSCCHTDEGDRTARRKCGITETAATTMNFITFSPSKASSGQSIEAGAFLTPTEEIYFRGQQGIGQVITDENLSKNISFELTVFPSDALKKMEEGEEDNYRDSGILHKIWTFEVQKCGIVDLHFKLIDKDGVTLGEQHRCIDISPSWSFFIQSHPFELATLSVSIAALLVAGVDAWLKIKECCRRKKIRKRNLR